MKEYIKTILVEHISSRPEYLLELFRQMYKETAIEFKEKLNSKEAAYYLGISIKTLDNVCCNRQISYYKYGKQREFSIDDLKQYKKKKERYFKSLY